MSVAQTDEASSRLRLLATLGLVCAIVIAITELLIADGPLSGIYIVYLFPASGALYIAAGLLAWWRRPGNRLGSLMTACGVALVLSGLANAARPAFIAVGLITATLPLSVQIHLVLASPGGRVQGRLSKATVRLAYVVGLILQVPLWAFAPEPPPFNVLLVSPRPDLVSLGSHIQESVGALVVASTVVLLIRRLREFGTTERRLLASFQGYAIFAVLLVVVGGDVLQPLGIGNNVVTVQIAAFGLVPLGFLVVVLRGGFQRPSQDLFARSVAASANETSDLDDAVAVALGDPTAVLLRWQDGEYVDSAGSAVAFSQQPPHRSTMPIGGPTAPLGALLYDTTLGNPGSLNVVTGVMEIVLEREQMAREVSASQVALQESSRRVLEAADAERRRIARDLHDGLQGSLVLLSLRVRQLAADSEGEHAGRALALAAGLDAAAVTLRALVDGVIPPPLIERGLIPAIRDLAGELPFGAEIHVTETVRSLPERVETTAYFVVSEALTNVVKHAGASRVWICVDLASEQLTIEISDDGVGFTGHRGSGLSGLRDRLSMVGGSLDVSGTGGGTRLLATLPCF